MNFATHSARNALKTWRSFSPTALTKLKGPNVPHIIIVGGGVAGLILATRLGDLLGRRDQAKISLIDRSWIHVWKPMLHTFAAGTWNIYQQQVQFVAHARMHHFEYIPGHLEAVQQATGCIRLSPLRADGQVVAGARELDYDLLVLAFGSALTTSPRQVSLNTVTLSIAKIRPKRSMPACGRTSCVAWQRAATSISPSSAAAPPVLSWQPSSAGWSTWPPAMARLTFAGGSRDPAGERPAHSHCISRGDLHLSRIRATRAGRGCAHRSQSCCCRWRGLPARRGTKGCG
jgi:Pyridine nucleotide-disulphide oxidoreductase